MSAESMPGQMFVLPKSQARIWVRDGRPTLTIITDAPDGLGLDWPEANGALMIFDGSFEVSVTVVPS